MVKVILGFLTISLIISLVFGGPFRAAFILLFYVSFLSWGIFGNHFLSF